MARAVRTVVQGERLRDQVYRFLREDLKSARLKPGARIVEAELAERYNVSRTPVREALFQLSRDGLLIAAPDRGYVVPVDTEEGAAHRHEVRYLLDPKLAWHAAIEGSAEQQKRLAKAFERERTAHLAGKVDMFSDANHLFRDTLREMCGNELLARCSALLDDHAQSLRTIIFKNASYRSLQLEHDGKLLEAVIAQDGAAAEAAARDYIAAVQPYQINDPYAPEEPLTAAG